MSRFLEYGIEMSKGTRLSVIVCWIVCSWYKNDHDCELSVVKPVYNLLEIWKYLDQFGLAVKYAFSRLPKILQM